MLLCAECEANLCWLWGFFVLSVRLICPDCDVKLCWVCAKFWLSVRGVRLLCASVNFIRVESEADILWLWTSFVHGADCCLADTSWCCVWDLFVLTSRLLCAECVAHLCRVCGWYVMTVRLHCAEREDKLCWLWGHFVLWVWCYFVMSVRLLCAERRVKWCCVLGYFVLNVRLICADCGDSLC